MKIYTYKNCSTCKNALRFLDANGINYKNIPIRETPPSLGELKTMLKAYDGNIQKLFNTSGQDYRSMGLKDKLPSMSEVQKLKLLSEHGNLVKRPFLISGKQGRVGFKEDEWKTLLAEI